MKDWKERVTSNRKLAAINVSAGSHPAMPFGHWPGGEQAAVALASQKTQLHAPAHQCHRPLGSRPPWLLVGGGWRAQPQPPKSRQGGLNHQKNIANLRRGEWARLGRLGKAGETGGWHVVVAQSHPRGFVTVEWEKAGSTHTHTHTHKISLHILHIWIKLGRKSLLKRF